MERSEQDEIFYGDNLIHHPCDNGKIRGKQGYILVERVYPACRLHGIFKGVRAWTKSHVLHVRIAYTNIHFTGADWNAQIIVMRMLLP